MNNIHIKLNGEWREVGISPGMRLLDLLRDELKLTGTKEGCGEGECGVCSVIMNGHLVNSCLVMAFQAEKAEVLTIEGLKQSGEYDPIQQAFIDIGAVQCGFCTPGMIMAGKALLLRNPKPTREEIRRGISGNLCRCTGYEKIVEAIENASKA